MEVIPQLKVSSLILRKRDTSSFPRVVFTHLAEFLLAAEVLSSALSALCSILIEWSGFFGSGSRVFTPVSIQALVSKTLDQASAQFAASALVTTDQLLAFKSKEELVLASGVNGVLAGTGECPRFLLLLQQLLCRCCVYKSCPVPSRCFQRLAPSQHHHSPSPAQPVGTHYPVSGPNLPPALLQLHDPFACQRRPLFPRLHSQRPRSGSAGDPGLQRCQRHPRHHSGPHRKQHLSERAVGRHAGWAPHPPDPRQRATLCLKAVHHHQPADAQSLRSVVHGPGFKVRLCCTRTALTLQALFNLYATLI